MGSGRWSDPLLLGPEWGDPPQPPIGQLMKLWFMIVYPFSQLSWCGEIGACLEAAVPWALPTAPGEGWSIGSHWVLIFRGANKGSLLPLDFCQLPEVLSSFKWD